MGCDGRARAEVCRSRETEVGMDIYMYLHAGVTEEGAKGRARQLSLPSRTEPLLFKHARAHRPALTQFVFHHSAVRPSAYKRFLIGPTSANYSQRPPVMGEFGHSLMHVPPCRDPTRGTRPPS